MNNAEATKKVPNQGYNGTYMEMEGPCHVLLAHYVHVNWITSLSRRQYDFRLSIYTGDIDNV